MVHWGPDHDSLQQSLDAAIGRVSLLNAEDWSAAADAFRELRTCFVHFGPLTRPGRASAGPTLGDAQAAVVISFMHLFGRATEGQPGARTLAGTFWELAKIVEQDLARQAPEDARRFVQGLPKQRSKTAAAAKAEAARAEEAAAAKAEAARAEEAAAAKAEAARGEEAAVLAEKVGDPSLPTGQLVGSRAGFQVAMRWERTAEQLVRLDGRPECQAERDQVAQGFLRTSKMARRVLAVWRVQNLQLWRLYVDAVRSMRGAELGTPAANEDLVWHGARGNTHKILQNGFLVFNSTPKGVWLSPTSEYSAQYFCTLEGNSKRILLVRAALGTIGPAPGGSGLDSILIPDHAHIVPNGCRAYPAYVLEFAE